MHDTTTTLAASTAPTTTEPKFRQVALQLAADIASGKLQPGDKLPGERILAQRYGISHPTINKALGGLVEMGVLRRELGRGTYVADPSPVGDAGLRPGDDHTTSGGMHADTSSLLETALVAMDLDPRHHLPLMTALPRFLSQNQRLPLLLDGGPGTDCGARFESQARDGMWCILNFHVDIPYLTLKRVAERCRCVFLGEYVHASRLPGSYILNDLETGAAAAVRHLIARGRRRFLLVSAKSWTPLQSPTIWERGARAALLAAGLPPPVVVCGADTTPDTHRQLFTGPDAPDAVLSINDFRLVEMLRAVSPLALRPGVDFDAIGGYDTPWAEAWGLSSLAFDVDRMLAHLGGVLTSGEPVDIRVAPHLVHRRSSPALESGAAGLPV